MSVVELICILMRSIRAHSELEEQLKSANPHKQPRKNSIGIG
jgi:hypothetical protein